MPDKSGRRGSARDEPGAMAFGIPPWLPGFGTGAPDQTGWNGKAVEDLTRVGAKLGTEYVDFVNRRLKEDINLMPRLAACKSPAEVADVYAEFWRKLSDDYVNELAVLGKLSGDFANAFAASGQKPQS